MLSCLWSVLTQVAFGGSAAFIQMMMMKPVQLYYVTVHFHYSPPIQDFLFCYYYSIIMDNNLFIICRQSFTSTLIYYSYRICHVLTGFMIPNTTQFTYTLSCYLKPVPPVWGIMNSPKDILCCLLKLSYGLTEVSTWCAMMKWVSLIYQSDKGRWVRLVELFKYISLLPPIYAGGGGWGQMRMHSVHLLKKGGWLPWTKNISDVSGPSFPHYIVYSLPAPSDC